MFTPTPKRRKREQNYKNSAVSVKEGLSLSSCSPFSGRKMDVDDLLRSVAHSSRTLSGMSLTYLLANFRVPLSISTTFYFPPSRFCLYGQHGSRSFVSPCTLLILTPPVEPFWADARVQFFCLGVCGCLLVLALLFAAVCLICSLSSSSASSAQRNRLSARSAIVDTANGPEQSAHAWVRVASTGPPDVPDARTHDVQRRLFPLSTRPDPVGVESVERDDLCLSDVPPREEATTRVVACVAPSAPLSVSAHTPVSAQRPRSNSVLCDAPADPSTPPSRPEGQTSDNDLTPQGDMSPDSGAHSSQLRLDSLTPQLAPQIYPRESLETLLSTTVGELESMCLELEAAEVAMCAQTEDADHRLRLSASQEAVEQTRWLGRLTDRLQRVSVSAAPSPRPTPRQARTPRAVSGPTL